MSDASNATLIECAWEVCNKVGGIYQVIRSKAPKMVERWGRRYTLLGPCPQGGPPLEFEARRPSGRMATAIKHLADKGIVVHHGEWLVSGAPRVLLVDQVVDAKRLGEIKYDLWQQHGIDCRSGDWALDKAVWFSDCTRRLIAAAQEEPASADPRVLAHFPDWLGTPATPRPRRRKGPAAPRVT